jgi:hypothetical protein
MRRGAAQSKTSNGVAPTTQYPYKEYIRRLAGEFGKIDDAAMTIRLLTLFFCALMAWG